MIIRQRASQLEKTYIAKEMERGCVFFSLLSLLGLITPGISRHPPHRCQQSPGDMIANYEIFTPVIEYDDAQAVSNLSIVTSKYNFTLRLTMNRHLLSHGFSSIHFDPQDRKTITEGRFNCFYQGTVDGYPSWTAAISTCNGLRGSFGDMATRTKLYNIEPLAANMTKSLDQAHVIYVETEHANKTRNCATPHETVQRSNLFKLNERAYKRQTPGNLIVELVIVNDLAQYQKYGSSLETTVNRAIEIINGVDGLYKPLGIRIVLVQVITWSSGDKITVVPDPNTLLDSFRVSYAPTVSVQHDATMLLTGTDLTGNVVGLAYVDAMCSSYAVGLVQDFGSQLAVASTTAHEMGHLFSMMHDTASCTCAQSTGCIMGAVLGSVVPNQWSSCSTQSLSTALSSNHGFCLTNLPQSTVGTPKCGNGIREGNETCDCGSAKECTDPCCNPSTCQLAAGAQCTGGACCNNCRFVAYGTQCRASIGECDVAETCTGCSSQCPANQYVQDGTSCGSGSGYCYGGACPARDSQCKAFYGPLGGDGVSSCYSNYNPRGDLHGNCGPTGTSTYAACAASNVFCGSLQCANTGDQFPTVNIVGSTQLGTHGPTATTCKSFTLTPSDGSTTNIWLVQNGTKCGISQICLSSQCLPLSALKLPSCSIGANGLVCSGNGVCLNDGTCACKVGFTGSLCNTVYTGPVCSVLSTSATKVTSTPGGVTSTPARVASTPAAITSTPARVTSTPAAITSTPARVTSTPAAITSTPARVTSTPAAITSTPARVTSTPAAITSTPARVTSTPAVITSTPARVTSTPAAITSTPARVTSTPARVTSAPAAITSTPARVTSTPAAISSTPARVTSTPARVTSTPAAITSTPARVTSTPAAISSTPARVTSTPAGITSTPARVTSTPAAITSTPARLTSTPARVTSTPARVTSTPAGITSSSAKVTSTPVKVTTPV